MKLKLNKPIVFFDIESTGLNILTDRIVEISILKVYPDQHEEVTTYRVNPTIPISEEAQAIHGISNDDVKDKPSFAQIAHNIAKIFEGADIGGFNSNKFDIPMLAEELLRAGINIDFHRRVFVDVQNIFHKMEKRDLSAAYKFYCNKDLTNAHSADADTMATYEILQAQLDRYSDSLKNDVNALAEFSTMRKTADYMGRIVFDENDKEIFNFGKHKGKRVEDVFNKIDPNYYAWMMNGEFAEDTKRVITEIKLRSKKI